MRRAANLLDCFANRPLEESLLKLPAVDTECDNSAGMRSPFRMYLLIAKIIRCGRSLPDTYIPTFQRSQSDKPLRGERQPCARLGSRDGAFLLGPRDKQRRSKKRNAESRSCCEGLAHGNGWSGWWLDQELARIIRPYSRLAPASLLATITLIGRSASSRAVFCKI